MKNSTTPAPVRDKAKEAARDYKAIREDYAFVGGVLGMGSDRVGKVKWILQQRLSDVDRTLLILYADCLSYRKLGKRLGLSHTLVGKEIRRIRAKVLEEYERIKDTDIA